MERIEGGDYLLVSGAPRSGTTFVMQLLNSHPNVACLHEYGFDELLRKVGAFVKYSKEEAPSYDAAVAGPLRPTSLDDFVRSRDEAAAAVSGDAFLTFRDTHLDRLLKTFFEVVSAKRNLKVCGDKTPNIVYLHHKLDAVRARLGRIKRIYVVRRPVDVIQSSMRRSHFASLGMGVWRVRNIEEAMLEWIDNWEYIVNELKADRDDIYVLKYEDLINKFEDESSKLAAFLGVDNRFANMAAPTPDNLVDYRLSDDQIAAIEKKLGRLVTDWDRLPLITLMTENTELAVNFSGEKDFLVGGATEASRLFLRSGFSDVEPWGAWTCKPDAELRLSLDYKAAALRLEMKPFFPWMRIRSSVNGEEEVEHSIHRRRLKRFSDVHIKVEPPSREIRLKLRFPQTKRPDDKPRADPRQLGVGIRRLQIIPSA